MTCLVNDEPFVEIQDQYLPRKRTTFTDATILNQKSIFIEQMKHVALVFLWLIIFFVQLPQISKIERFCEVQKSHIFDTPSISIELSSIPSL